MTETCMVVGKHAYPCHNGKIVQAIPWEKVVVGKKADGTLIFEQMYLTEPPLHPPEGYPPTTYRPQDGIVWTRECLQPLLEFPLRERSEEATG